MAKATTKKKTSAKKTATAQKKTTRQTPSKSKQSSGQTAKKRSAKKSAKSTTTPRGTSKKTAATGRALVCADTGECFWTTDGQVLKDLAELRDALKAMHDEVFRYHVTKEKNDFADWVEEVLADAECAAALRKARKPQTARTVVVRHLRSYNL